MAQVGMFSRRHRVSADQRTKLQPGLLKQIARQSCPHPLTCQPNKHIITKPSSYLQNRDDGSVEVVGLRSFGVQDVDGVHVTGKNKNDGVVEKLGELFRVERGRGDDQLGKKKRKNSNGR